MVAIGIGVMRTQSFDRRIPERTTLEREVETWVRQRDLDGAISWVFTTACAIAKLAKASHQPGRAVHPLQSH